MIVRFDYIDDFFKRDTFTDIELANLRNTVEKNDYSSSERKAAMSYIDVNLAAYAMGGTISEPKPKRIKKVSNLKPQSEKNQDENKKKKRLKGKRGKPFENAKFNKSTKSYRKEYVSSETLRNVLEETISNKDADNGKEELSSIRHTSSNNVKKRYTRPLGVIRQFRKSKSDTENFKGQVKKFNKSSSRSTPKNKQKKTVTNSGFKPRKPRFRPTSSSKGVYGALASSKSVGKIIYTRMK